MMTLIERAGLRDSQRQQVLSEWASAHDIDLDRFDTGQRWVLYAALQAAKAVGSVAPLRRVLGFLLSRCGMDLGSQAIAAVVAVSDRSVRQTQALAPEELLERLRHPPGGNRPPKLLPEHAGPIAKFLVLNPQARAPAVLDYLQHNFALTVERHTLHEYLLRYGMGDLQQQALPLQSPPFWARPPTAEPSCC